MLDGDSPLVTMDTFEQNREFMEAVKQKIESEQIKVQLLTETDTKAKSEERKVQVPANFNNKRLNTPGFVRL